jgi:hypothetical protein
VKVLQAMPRSRLKTTGRGYERAGVRTTQPKVVGDQRKAFTAAFLAFEARHGRTPKRGWRASPPTISP